MVAIWTRSGFEPLHKSEGIRSPQGPCHPPHDRDMSLALSEALRKIEDLVYCLVESVYRNDVVKISKIAVLDLDETGTENVKEISGSLYTAENLVEVLISCFGVPGKPLQGADCLDTHQSRFSGDGNSRQNVSHDCRIGSSFGDMEVERIDRSID